MSKKVHLSFAVCSADGVGAWAFCIRGDAGRERGRYLHSGCDVERKSLRRAAMVAVGQGLRWLLDNNYADAKLLVTHADDGRAERAAVSGALDCPPELQEMKDKLFGYSERFKAIEVREIPRDDVGSDWLARWCWEGATLQPFPQRPTDRRPLPGMTRTAVLLRVSDRSELSAEQINASTRFDV